LRIPTPHPAFRLAILIALGIVAGDRLDLSLLLLVWIVSLLCVSILILACLGPLTRLAVTVPSVLLLVAIGALRLAADRGSAPVIPDRVQRDRVTVIGTVIDPPTVRGRRIRCTLRSSACIAEDEVIPLEATIAVTVSPVAQDTAWPPIAYGMRLVLEGDLSVPAPARNPGEFSQRQYDDANGITGNLFVRGSGNVRAIDAGGGSWVMTSIIVPVRKFILREIDESVGGEEGEFLKGLLIGDRSGIPADMNQAFVDSGVAHILAVSGSNVAVVAMILVFLYDILRLPRRLRPFVVAAALLLYMMVTGNQASVVRATVMALVFLLAEVLQEKSNVYNAVGLAAMLILLYDARQLFDVGFQLSFGAVLSIVHLYPRANVVISRLGEDRIWKRSAVWVLRLCAVSLVATLGTLPVTAACFGRVSLVGVLANLPVIPATGLSVILGAASIISGIVSPGVAEAYGAVNALVLHLTITIARVAASMPFATMDTFRFSALEAIPFYAALGLVFHRGEKNVTRVLLMVLLCSLNLMVAVSLAETNETGGGLRMSVIDVGEGDALLVEFPRGETMVIDGGGFSPDFDAGEKTVTPFLKRRGISRIDLLVVSHPHSDHVGGVPSLFRHFDVGRVIDSGQPVRADTYRAYLRAVAAHGCPHHQALAGTILDGIADVRLYVLGPVVRFVDCDTTHSPPNLNNTSVVIRLVYGGVSFLLAGDAEDDAEKVMVERYGGFLRSNLLKAGHHGSSTSSSPGFLEAVRPTRVVVSVGLHNSFRHPSALVIERFERSGVDLARTDREGAIMYETDGTVLRRVDWR